MTPSPSEALTFKEERPWLFWFTLLWPIVVGVSMIVQGELIGGGVFLFFSGLWALMGPGEITTFDPLRSSVVIKQRSFFRPPVCIEIPFDDIVGVGIEHDRDSEGEEYFVVLVRRTGRPMPLRATCSGARWWCENQAQQISALLADSRRPVPVINAPISQQVREGRSGSVAWRLETLAQGGVRGVLSWHSSWREQTVLQGTAQGVTRWFSAAAPLPGQLIALCQTHAGMSRPLAWGPGVWLARSGFVGVYLKPFLLDSSKLAGIDSASYVAGLEPRLSTHFFTLSTSAEAARAWLTPRVVSLLVAWAEQHPVSRNPVVLQRDEFNMLTVLVSPNGLWVMCHEALKDPAKIEELVALGVALVQAQQDVAYLSRMLTIPL